MPGYGNKGGGGRGGGGRGRGGGMGAVGNCICVKCGCAAPKKPGTPCMQEKCPNCGGVLMREGGSHYQQAVKEKK
jgi:NAD-dependent SIR2 family protein deacetylase